MKTWQQIGAEWLDTLVVAISVAMCFRAYFFEPFNIPTGSMRPTLYGNHYAACAKPGVWDTTPGLKWLQWLWRGYDYKELKAPGDGQLQVVPRNDGRLDLYIGRNRLGCIPTDAPITPGQWFRRGQTVFKGYDVTGDFIFVNRLTWNFRQPRRGDVMVFSTTGIDGLAQGTHYIKRMAGVPGETVDFKVSETKRQPDGTPGYELVVNGEAVDYRKPEGACGEPALAPCPLPTSCAQKVWEAPYTLRNEPGAREYLAFGDNSYPVQNSFDSRYFGPVPETKLRGCASIVFWPFNPRWGVIR